MLQDDLFSDQEDTQQETASKKHSASPKPPSPHAPVYKKIDLTRAQIAASPDNHAKSSQTGLPVAAEDNHFPSTATLLDIAPGGSKPVGSVLPVLTTPELPADPQAHESQTSESQINESPVDEPELSDNGKAPGAFKTISEAAGLLGVPQHVLRFWESRFSQIKPLKMRGGRRYYRPEDMEVLSTVKHLLYKQGYTIKGAKKVFSTRNREALEAAQRETSGIIPPVIKKAAEAPRVTEKPVMTQKPVFDDRKKKQLSNIRNELLGLRETLSTYLT